jgi:uncharacterized membrane protein
VSIRGRLADQRGLIGKVLALVLVLVVVIGLVGAEGGSILFARFRLQRTADAAAATAATTFLDTRNAKRACQSALQAIHQRDSAGSLARCAVTPGGAVTLVVRKEAPTLVVQRVSWLRSLGIIDVTSTARPPPA